MILEVCATSLQSALNAQEGGAQRVELCDNLYEGGTTPGPGTIQLTREKLHIRLNVMIRPRGGDFLYSDTEFEIIKKDILFCKATGCDGVVFGFLNADGTINTKRTSEAVEIARPMSVTFHRAFDMTKDPFEALELLIDTGVDRILTAGQKNKAPDGQALIAELVKKAGDRVIIMPGAGINEDNITALLHATGAKEFHLTGHHRIESRMKYKKTGIFMGSLPQIPEYSITETDTIKIKNITKLIESTWYYKQ